MQHVIITLTVLRTATLLLGFVFLAYTWRAWLRHRNRALLVLFVAVALLTLGVLAEGVAVQLMGLSIEDAHIVESVFMLAGFAVLVYSVLRPGTRRRDLDASSVAEGEQDAP